MRRKAVVTGELTRNRGRWLEVRGEVRSEDGKVVAESRGIFMRLPEEKVRELDERFSRNDSGRGETDRG